eukprot:1791691-Pleurochrysis_carterae.AAC.1
MQQYEKALEDADECVRLQPTWAKGYSRRAAAKFHLGDLQAAKLAYSKAWDLEPTNLKTKARALRPCSTPTSPQVDASTRAQRSDVLPGRCRHWTRAYAIARVRKLHRRARPHACTR